MSFKSSKITGLLALLLFLITGSSAFAQEALYCGDGIVSEDEECDDGNFINRDGCSSYCLAEDMTPASVETISIPNGQTDVSTLTNKIILTFTEPVDANSLNKNTVFLRQYNNPLKIDLELNEQQTQLTLHILESLEGEKKYSVKLQNYKDLPGNTSTELFVSTFVTGQFIDVIPPNIITVPEGGLYNVGQSVSLTPYLGDLTFSDEYIDEDATIYYTLNGIRPGTHSNVYSKPISIKKNTTLKYFGVDEKGNKSEVITQTYTFACAENPNAKTITPYPECSIQECNRNAVLRNNVCVIKLGDQDPDDYKTNAVTAPLFGSDTPVIISTKPALYISPEHEGIIPRPIHFVDLAGGTIIDLERDTLITHLDGRPFTGYLRPPESRYSKSFPINFGYSFKSIFHLESAEGSQLKFDPPLKITVPFTDRYNQLDSINVFTFDPVTEEYFEYPPELVSITDLGDGVSISSETTGTFFIAQRGKNYNAIVFKDTSKHWAKNYIEQLYRWGHVKGRSKGVFAPDDILTRAEFTKIALNAVGEEVDPLENVEDAPFYDVALYAWYTPYLKRAKEMNLIRGYPDGSFKPDFPINKVEAIKILMEAFEFDLTAVGARNDSFADVLTKEWYFPSVNFALFHKLVDGIRLPNGTIQYSTFGPGRNMTRGEMAKLAVKAIELKNEER